MDRQSKIREENWQVILQSLESRLERGDDRIIDDTIAFFKNLNVCNRSIVAFHQKLLDFIAVDEDKAHYIFSLVEVHSHSHSVEKPEFYKVLLYDQMLTFLERNGEKILKGNQMGVFPLLNFIDILIKSLNYQILQNSTLSTDEKGVLAKVYLRTLKIGSKALTSRKEVLHQYYHESIQNIKQALGSVSIFHAQITYDYGKWLFEESQFQEAENQFYSSYTTLLSIQQSGEANESYEDTTQLMKVVGVELRRVYELLKGWNHYYLLIDPYRYREQHVNQTFEFFLFQELQQNWSNYWKSTDQTNEIVNDYFQLVFTILSASETVFPLFRDPLKDSIRSHFYEITNQLLNEVFPVTRRDFMDLYWIQQIGYVYVADRQYEKAYEIMSRYYHEVKNLSLSSIPSETKSEKEIAKTRDFLKIIRYDAEVWRFTQKLDELPLDLPPQFPTLRLGLAPWKYLGFSTALIGLFFPSTLLAFQVGLVPAVSYWSITSESKLMHTLAASQRYPEIIRHKDILPAANRRLLREVLPAFIIPPIFTYGVLRLVTPWSRYLDKFDRPLIHATVRISIPSLTIFLARWRPSKIIITGMCFLISPDCTKYVVDTSIRVYRYYTYGRRE